MAESPRPNIIRRSGTISSATANTASRNTKQPANASLRLRIRDHTTTRLRRIAQHAQVLGRTARRAQFDLDSVTRQLLCVVPAEFGIRPLLGSGQQYDPLGRSGTQHQECAPQCERDQQHDRDHRQQRVARLWGQGEFEAAHRYRTPARIMR